MISQDDHWKLFQRLGMSHHSCVIVERSMLLLVSSLKAFRGDVQDIAELHALQIKKVSWLYSLTAGQLREELVKHFRISDDAVLSINRFISFRNELIHHIPVEMPQAGDTTQSGHEFFKYLEYVDGACFAAMSSLATIEPLKERDQSIDSIFAMKKFLAQTREVWETTSLHPPIEFHPYINER